MKRYGYHRTSTKEQHLDRGITEINEYCSANNLELEKIFTDQQTGKNFNRPRYTIMKEDVLREGDELIITEVDRLGRNKQETLKELQYYRDNGIRVKILELPTTLMDLSAMDNAMARMIMETINNMLIELYATMAQAEIEKKEKRQKEGIQAKKERGEWDDYGRPSFISVPVLVRGLSGNGDDVKELYEKVLAVVSKEYPVKEVFKTASKGSYNLETKQIRVRGDMEYLQRLKSLCHEYAHAIHFMLRPENDLSRAGRELVAEASAFVICNRLGADTADYSISYLKSWMSESGDLKKVMDDIQKVSYTILTKLAESQDFAAFNLQEDNENER